MRNTWKWSILGIVILIVSGVVVHSKLTTFWESNDSHSKKYQNEEYGFQMSFPGDLNKLIVKKERKYTGDSLYGSSSEIILSFWYPLDTPMLRSEEDPTLGYIDGVNIWYITIVPRKDWRTNVCESGKPLCRQGRVLGENNAFVFEEGFMSIDGASYICRDYKNEQVNFCKVIHTLYDAIGSGEIGFEARPVL